MSLLLHKLLLGTVLEGNTISLLAIPILAYIESPGLDGTLPTSLSHQHTNLWRTYPLDSTGMGHGATPLLLTPHVFWKVKNTRSKLADTES